MSVHIPVNYLIQVYAAQNNVLTCLPNSQATLQYNPEEVLQAAPTQKWMFIPLVNESNTYYIHNGVTDTSGNKVYLRADTTSGQLMGGNYANATAWTIVPSTISVTGLIESFTLKMSNSSSTVGSDTQSPSLLVVGGGHTIIWDVLVQDELVDIP